MKYYEAGKELIIFVALAVVALLVIGALGTGQGSYVYSLNNANTSACNFNVTGGNCISSTPNYAVNIISGAVVPILFLVAIGLKFV